MQATARMKVLPRSWSYPQVHLAPCSAKEMLDPQLLFHLDLEGSKIPSTPVPCFPCPLDKT